MLSRVRSFVLTGIDARPCEVEVDLDESAIERATVVGLPDTAVRESLERVRAAVGNSGYRFPPGRLLVNLAPADVRKEGPVYDLPIAAGLLRAAGVAQSGLDPRGMLMAGELALDGRVRPVRGVIAAAHLAASQGLRGVIVPQENAPEAAVVPGIEVYAVGSLTELVGLLSGGLEPSPHPPVDVAGAIERDEAPLDFAEIRGQEAVKRGLLVAAAGGHNALMVGPAGTGKTMMARALPGILPPLRPDEAIDITRVHSAAGQLNGDGGSGLVTRRPVRAPHHTASSAAIIGGGAIPGPGEISLAHRGVLFLDELPEFPRAVLDTLRQPLEEGAVTISRSHSTARFPARFMLIAAMNPTAKGDLPTDAAGRRAMDRYLSRLSRPLLDRIDVHLEAPAVPWRALADSPAGTGTAEMRERVLGARCVQHARQGESLNAQLTGRELDRFAPLTEEAQAMLGEALTELGLSARAYDKIRRLARTIGDLDADHAPSEPVGLPHLAEAVQYRLLDRQH
ncbi:MAG: YifB family Mg chelatase-like AAA ATPase [Planctomycetota bacterium]